MQLQAGLCKAQHLPVLGDMSPAVLLSWHIHISTGALLLHHYPVRDQLLTVPGIECGHKRLRWHSRPACFQGTPSVQGLQVHQGMLDH